MLATILGAGCFLIGNPCAVGVTEFRQCFSFDGYVANGTNLMLATIFGTSGFLIGNPIAVDVAEFRQDFSFDGCIANGTNLMFATIFGTSGFFVGNPFTIGVSEWTTNAFIAFQTFLGCCTICFGKFLVFAFARA